MASNHKLTGVIAGRTIQSLSIDSGKLSATFDDGSTMSVKLGAPPPDTTKIGTVKAVRQSGTTLDIDFEDGSTLEIEMIEESSSVMLRDANRKMEYAD